MKKTIYTLAEKKQKMNENNRKLFEQYEMQLEENSSKVNYTTTISTILMYVGEKNIEEVSIHEIGEYISKKSKKANTYNKDLSYIKSFYDYLIKNKLIKDIGINNFYDLRIKKVEDEEPANPLTPYQITKIRKIFFKNKFLLTLFELFYEYSITWTEIAKIGKIYNFRNKEFKRGSNFIKVSDYIAELIEENIKSFDKDIKNKWQHDLKEINIAETLENEIGRKVTYRDIKETKKKNSIKCPICEKEYENISDNWALIQYEEDYLKRKWLVCIECAKSSEV